MTRATKEEEARRELRRATKRAWAARKKAEDPGYFTRNQQTYRARGGEKAWREANPEKVKAINRRARAGRREARIVERRRYKLKRFGMSRKSERALYLRARKLVPAGLAPEARDDIIGAVLLGVMEGRFKRRLASVDISIVTKEYYKKFSKFDASLDDVFGDGVTRGQMMGVY